MLALRKTLICLLTISPLTVSALEVGGGIDLHGEMSFDYNAQTSGNNYYPGVNGAGNDQYRFAQAQLLATKETDDFSFLARLNYQPIELNIPGSATTKQSFGTVDEIHLLYKVTPEISAGFGRLCSTMGYESILRSENVFYTNTVAYQSLVPGYGEGVRLRYNPGEYLSATLSSYNRATYNLYGDDYTATKTTEVSVTGAWKNLTWFAGHYWGTDRETATTTPIDKKSTNAWVSYKFSDSLLASVIFDGRSQKPNGGTEIHAQSLTSLVSYTWQRHTFGLRYESLMGIKNLDALTDLTGAFYSSGDSLQVWTIGDRIQIKDNLHLHIEYRQDVANEDIFKDKDDSATDHLHMFTLGAVAYF